MILYVDSVILMYIFFQFLYKSKVLEIGIISVALKAFSIGEIAVLESLSSHHNTFSKYGIQIFGFNSLFIVDFKNNSAVSKEMSCSAQSGTTSQCGCCLCGLILRIDLFILVSSSCNDDSLFPIG